MKKAFLVGINKYEKSPLYGCVNDCLLSYKILSEKFDFDRNYIDIITDEQCTKKNILEGLRKLTFEVKPGDTILFHYSGHGSQIVSNDWTNNKEADGRDEILCSYDMNWDDPIRDNDLNRIFCKVPCGVKTVVILDCCHSGTGLRNFFKSKSKDIVVENVINRFLEPPVSNILSNPTISLDNNLQYVFPKFNVINLQTKLNRFLVETSHQGEAILISGCKENQTSADANIGGRYHGALTYVMYNVLMEHNFRITYGDLIKEINKTIKKIGFEQTPQLECKKDYHKKIFLE